MSGIYVERIRGVFTHNALYKSTFYYYYYPPEDGFLFQ